MKKILIGLLIFTAFFALLVQAQVSGKLISPKRWSPGEFIAPKRWSPGEFIAPKRWGPGEFIAPKRWGVDGKLA